MSDQLESQLRLYSLGIVVADKARDSEDIQVHPTEILPLVHGPLTDKKTDVKSEVPDASAVPRKSETKVADVLTAKWLPGDSTNRMTAPDVMAGETVLIFRFADSDEYYWRTVFREPTIRRLETVYYVYGNVTEPLKEIGKENSYWFQVSTHDKIIKLHTTKCDKDPKEPYTYDIELDTGRGILTITDDVKNTIVLTSKDGELKITTNKKVVVKSKDIEIEGKVSIKGDTSIKGNVKLDGAVETTSNVEIKGKMNAKVVSFGGTTMIVP
jgi:hypothetical protein